MTTTTRVGHGFCGQCQKVGRLELCEDCNTQQCVDCFDALGCVPCSLDPEGS